MNWLKFILVFAFLLGGSTVGRSQILSERSSISLLTCDEGSELHTLFGHSALRVVDPASGMDIVFNYGLFNYGESDLEFALTFAQGKLDYYLGVEDFQNFTYEYNYYKRGVREQVLNLPLEGKQKIFNALQNNYLPENRAYRYDFFFDNCATRIRAIIDSTFKKEVAWVEHPDANQYTYREIIDRNLVVQPWSDYGIDLALGAKIDVKVSNENLMFLPKYMEEIFAQSTINGQPLVKETNMIYAFDLADQKVSFWRTPSFLFWGLLIFAMLFSFLERQAVMRYFDSLFFTVMALGGIIVLLLWFATDHAATKVNYNLLWANPIHFVIVFALIKKKYRIKWGGLFRVLMFFYFALFLLWFILPQSFHPATRPLILIMGIRYYYWYAHSRKVQPMR